MINTADEVDSWLDQFKDMRPSSRRAEREARAKQERRTQLTEKQRERSSSAVRTEQINFRCSSAFKKKAKEMQKHNGNNRSIADVLEQALDLFAKHEGYNG